ncbi:hypothetical protein M9H77_03145 [Catharanthus roseus]|uniref:Uncharacterized protein n=1 Tax=Catharanthus roseus TaxID=4058 RepID=A0ACC0CAK0_CATRO|nr:hypothetical protein M9H77_03145 [Catharanthus roseus]
MEFQASEHFLIQLNHMVNGLPNAKWVALVYEAYGLCSVSPNLKKEASCFHFGLVPRGSPHRLVKKPQALGYPKHCSGQPTKKFYWVPHQITQQIRVHLSSSPIFLACRLLQPYPSFVLRPNYSKKVVEAAAVNKRKQLGYFQRSSAKMIYDVNSPLFRSFLTQEEGSSDKR